MLGSVCSIPSVMRLSPYWLIIALTLVASHGARAADFPPEEGYTAMVGSCHESVHIWDVTPGIVPVDVDPVNACMSRSAPGDFDGDGLREVNLNLEIREEHAYIEGIGDITIDLSGVDQPGHVEALGTGSDFPAWMELRPTTVFITPIGKFYADQETYAAEINAFPPAGVHLLAPPGAELALRDEQGVQVGVMYPVSVEVGEEIPPWEFPGGCPPMIPAVSEWGLIVMVLVGMVVGTLVFGARRRVLATH